MLRKEILLCCTCKVASVRSNLCPRKYRYLMESFCTVSALYPPCKFSWNRENPRHTGHAGNLLIGTDLFSVLKIPFTCIVVSIEKIWAESAACEPGPTLLSNHLTSMSPSYVLPGQSFGIYGLQVWFTCRDSLI